VGPDDYGDVLGTVAHPSGDVEVPLPVWNAPGPAGRRFAEVVAARPASARELIALSGVLAEYDNGPVRSLPGQGLLRLARTEVGRSHA
jgi:hypothetical protein